MAGRVWLEPGLGTVRSDRLACGRETEDEDDVSTMLDDVLYIHSTCFPDAMGVFEKGLWMDAGDTKT
ncbi:MAG: hypothetical protein QXZ62_08220, partial [Candidatus Caldarchaeum sp.]